MLKFLKKSWKWLDSKKTVIGTTALIVSEYIPKHTLAHQILNGFGQIVGVIGVSHKGYKNREKLPSGVKSKAITIKNVSKSIWQSIK